MNDLYIATVDDYVRVFLQMVRYYQFLEGESPRIDPSKAELLLQVAQRYAQYIGNPKGLNDAMAIILGGGDYFTRDPHFEGEEVFGSQKWMPNLPPGSQHDLHHLDKVNFSQLHYKKIESEKRPFRNVKIGLGRAFSTH